MSSRHVDVVVDNISLGKGNRSIGRSNFCPPPVIDKRNLYIKALSPLSNDGHGIGSS